MILMNVPMLVFIFGISTKLKVNLSITKSFVLRNTEIKIGKG